VKRYRPPKHDAEFLGVLCPRNHDHEGSGLSLRDRRGHCKKCAFESQKARLADPQYRAERNAKLRKHRQAHPEIHKARDKRDRERIRERGIPRKSRNNPEYKRRRYYAAPDRERKRSLEYYRAHPEFKERQKLAKKRKRKEHPGIVRATARDYYQKNTLRIRLRNRLYGAFVQFSVNGKVGMASEYGVDFSAIINHLGPCPGARSDWHIDHIKPLALFDFDDPEQVAAAFAPDNHQWLPAKINMEKSCRYTGG
jgi:hypothetical protein